MDFPISTPPKNITIFILKGFFLPSYLDRLVLLAPKDVNLLIMRLSGEGYLRIESCSLS